MMRIIDPQEINQPDLYALLVGIVAPRPIAFVSTTDAAGVPNLAPYSFFNVFSSAPPIVVFSSNRRASDNTTKDTLENVRATGEAVINMVSYAMVRQMSLASIEYPPEVNEFEKAGFTAAPADLVKPYRVLEAPAQLECRVQNILDLGTGPGAGHLVICEVVRLHLHEAIFDGLGRIDPQRIDLVGRMGRAYYVRASGEAIHSIFRATDQLAIGFDQLPLALRHSTILTGNELAQLAGISALPTAAELAATAAQPEIAALLQQPAAKTNLQRLVQIELAKENIAYAAALAWLSIDCP